MSQQELAQREAEAASTAVRREPAAEQNTSVLVPLVDVSEDDTGITVVADVPGASRETLSLDVDSDTLTIEAPIALNPPTELQAVYAEVRSGRYRRSFTLSRELDSQRIEATLKDGVLTLRVPKLEKARPRRIEVKTA
ncbi:Hsp20/alpha crystallin family protein [Piscinibacter terrae]|uniref:Hsp20/alpha crystallin family protein n=1 Tax=Piscinibacter terrae TaxID=2496871 RepID=A0A3N7HPV5_9BURK|nr:Hsp20/alpha crystallin family protein [Albitalea terrae]RQP24237.1 Hsp20/alpha crystallin family protein [Albitalea terrae]